MLTSDAIKHYGNMSKVARALGVSRNCVWKWHHEKGGRIPAAYAAQIHVDTRGKIPFDFEQYGARE